MTRQARCKRVHSAVTHQVNMIEAGKVNVHGVVLTFASGQLPFLGLFTHNFVKPLYCLCELFRCCFTQLAPQALR